MTKLRRKINYLLTFVLALIVTMGHSTSFIYASSNISGNNTMGTAYNYGSWTSINSPGTAILYEDEQESWFKFNVGAGERIFVRVSSNRNYVGMKVKAKNGLGINEGDERKNPDNLIDSTGLTPALYVDIDNTSNSTKTYYVLVERGDTFEGNMYFSLSAENRIRKGNATFSFSETASNPGNNPFNPKGAESNIANINLTNSTAIPDEAKVIKVSTSSTQSPSQGNVRHMVKPGNSSIWYTSSVSSATSGHYNIKLEDDFNAKQIWSFKYNAMASASSTMKNIKTTFSWEYDMKNTEYKIFLN